MAVQLMEILLLIVFAFFVGGGGRSIYPVEF